MNNFEAPRYVNMSNENIPKIQTDQFEIQIPTAIPNDNIETDIETDEEPVLTTIKVILVQKSYGQISYEFIKCFTNI